MHMNVSLIEGKCCHFSAPKYVSCESTRTVWLTWFCFLFLFFVGVVIISATVWPEEAFLLWPAAAALIHSCREGKKVSVLLFCGCIFHFWSRQRFIRIKLMSIFDLHLWRDESSSCWPSFKMKRFVFVAGFTPMERREENFKVKVSYHFY